MPYSGSTDDDISRSLGAIVGGALRPTFRIQRNVPASISETSSGGSAQYDPSHTKQKRRRTSPQDHAFLEAAYAQNSKPDKGERAEIVKRVQLGEKEVQIWFQNRRQNDRRKSKPLLPHELIPHFRNGVPEEILHQTASPNASFSRFDADTSFTTDSAGPERSQETTNNDGRLTRPTNIDDLLNPSSSAATATTTDSSTSLPQQGDVVTPSSSFDGLQATTATAHEIVPSVENVASTTESSQTGSGRKRAHDEIVTSERSGPRSNLLIATPPELSRPSPFVRLAMTVDGAVKIRTNNEPTPSPPKLRAPPPRSPRDKNVLARSKSATVGSELFQDAPLKAAPPVASGTFGRSRDARTWEFYCDADAREALSSHAEAERSGSATSAINLIRSNSQKSRGHALSPANNRGNLGVKPQAENSKAPLSRTKSSMARLQHSGEGLASDDLKHSARVQAVSPSGDSDKENWAPGTRLSQHALRRTQPTGNSRAVLQNNEDVLYPDAPLAASSGRKNQHENVNGHRISPSKEKAKGEELDCINGLLSLSQGAWR